MFQIRKAASLGWIFRFEMIEELKIGHVAGFVSAKAFIMSTCKAWSEFCPSQKWEARDWPKTEKAVIGRLPKSLQPITAWRVSFFLTLSFDVS